MLCHGLEGIIWLTVTFCPSPSRQTCTQTLQGRLSGCLSSSKPYGLSSPLSSSINFDSDTRFESMPTL